ncbi:hypothetical protein [Hungatella effluvii]|uniref:hypothetical protein n=1 Tax=Hungatella effluvii TaxID=1096246 RepID=UPI003A8D62CF
MHIHKFADLAQFNEVGIGGTLPATEVYRKLLKKLHPSQMLTARISVPLYAIRYAYLTVRQNYRITVKYLFLSMDHEDFDTEAEIILSDWVSNFNKAHPYRQISNVKILEIRRIAYAEIPLQI